MAVQDLILCDFTMDSTTGKERGDYPKWPASKGPGYFSAFLRDMAAFMMRVKLYIFARPTVAELPAAFTPAAPAGGGGISTRARANDAAEDEAIASTPRYKFFDIDSEQKYEEASMNAYGYLSKSVQDYPELRDAIYERIVNKNKNKKTTGSVSCVLRL